ncbi:Ldh family oxidoreductase [Streptomyces erythrochromogenes]|uniref:Ldh family oxidoreductase n=1 Tax=Streptomyces erythrochromogenes TaxID=285574 RepID=UPI0034309C7B
MISVPAAALTVYLERAFRAVGMPRSGAQTMAQTLVEAETRGLPGHGIRLAPAYLRKLHDGSLNPRPKITCRAEGPGVLALDGDLAAGPVAARNAVGAATIRARKTGLGLVTVCRTGHAGALGVFVTWAARHGLVAMLAAQTSAASVALLGGSGGAILGNSALAVAVPGRDPEEPVCVDLAAGAMSWGRVHQRRTAGKRLAPGSALDAAGHPTVDPAQAAVLLPAGERAQALAIVLELLVGALAASSPLPAGGQGRGLLCLAIDPRALGVAHLADSVTQVARQVRADGARMPGDRAWHARTAAATAGVRLQEDDLRALVEAAGPNVPTPAWARSPQPASAMTAGQEQ